MIAQEGGTKCIVQLAHSGRMSPAGAGMRPADMPALRSSSVPVKLGDTWLNEMALSKTLSMSKAITLAEFDQVIAGFAGAPLHGAHGFLLSQFLSLWTNRREGDYVGTPETRLIFLRRLVAEIREVCPPPFCLSVKLNLGDYMAECRLSTDEALEQVRWLLECGKMDFVEISDGNAEQSTPKLQNSFDQKPISKAPVTRRSTRIREAFLADFAERVQELNFKVPVELSGGFRSRIGMADAVASGICDLVGIGRAVVLKPSISRDTLLNPDLTDEVAVALPHIVRGQWLARWIPVKVVSSGLAIQFLYWNMQKLENGLKSDPYASIPYILLVDNLGMINSKLRGITETAKTRLPGMLTMQAVQAD